MSKRVEEVLDALRDMLKRMPSAGSLILPRTFVEEASESEMDEITEGVATIMNDWRGEKAHRHCTTIHDGRGTVIIKWYTLKRGLFR